MPLPQPAGTNAPPRPRGLEGFVLGAGGCDLPGSLADSTESRYRVTPTLNRLDQLQHRSDVVPSGRGGDGDGDAHGNADRHLRSLRGAGLGRLRSGRTQAPVVGIATIAPGSGPFARASRSRPRTGSQSGREPPDRRRGCLRSVRIEPDRKAVASIRFDFRAAGSGAWTASPADAAFPNPTDVVVHPLGRNGSRGRGLRYSCGGHGYEPDGSYPPVVKFVVIPPGRCATRSSVVERGTRHRSAGSGDPGDAGRA